MIIDAHQHPNWHDHNVDAIVANMDEFGIARSWLLTWELAVGEAPASTQRSLDPRRSGIMLEDVLEACRSHPDRFVAGYAPDPRLPDSMARLEAAVAMHGVRVCGEWKFRVLLDNPMCVEMFRLCGRLGIPTLIHIDVPYLPPCDPKSYCEWWYGGTLDNFERALAQCPETTFIAHGPGWWRSISGDADERAEAYPDGPVRPGGRAIDLMRRFQNLYADLSAGSGRGALARDTGFAREFLEEFQDRILFGRDQFDDSLMQLLRSLDIPHPIMDKILAGNALRLVPDVLPA